MQRITALLLTIAALTLGFQAFIWEHVTLFDGDFWITSAQHIAKDIPYLPIAFDAARHAGHPAMPPCLLRAYLYWQE